MSQNSFEIKIKLPNGTEESHSFTQEIVTVGRSKLNNLCLDIDKKISRKHFAFNFKEQVLSVVIENTVTNPVLLNGKQIFGLNIVDSGQTIQIGDSLIEIIRVTQLNQTENFPDIEIEEVDPQAEKTRVVQLDNFNPTQTENYDGNQIAEIYSKIEAVHKKRVEEVSGVHKIVEVTSEHKQQSNSDINGLDPEDEFTESASSVPNKKLIFYVACGLLIALSVAMLFFGKNKETAKFTQTTQTKNPNNIWEWVIFHPDCIGKKKCLEESKKMFDLGVIRYKESAVSPSNLYNSIIFLERAKINLFRAYNLDPKAPGQILDQNLYSFTDKNFKNLKTLNFSDKSIKNLSKINVYILGHQNLKNTFKDIGKLKKLFLVLKTPQKYIQKENYQKKIETLKLAANEELISTFKQINFRLQQRMKLKNLKDAKEDVLLLIKMFPETHHPYNMNSKKYLNAKF